MKNITSILFKTAVWIAILVIYTIVFFTLGNGLILGASFLLLIYCGFKLCKYIDWRLIEKKASEAGLSTYEYACQGLSEEFISKIEEACRKDNSSQLNKGFKVLIQKGKLTKEQALVFKKEFAKDNSST